LGRNSLQALIDLGKNNLVVLQVAAINLLGVIKIVIVLKTSIDYIGT
jgi:hypothetical protein